MKLPFDSPEAQFAVDAVREAALLVRQVQRGLVTAAIAKDDKSPVTVADFAAQAIVSRRLATVFPSAALVGEESAAALRTTGGAETLAQVARFVKTCEPDATADAVCQWIDRGVGDPPSEFWTLDPVDGTKGFLRKDQYAVALALVKDGRVEVGALGCPELRSPLEATRGGGGTLCIAVRGQGAYWQALDDDGKDAWTKLAASLVSRPAEIRLLRSVEKSHTDTGGIGALEINLGIAAESVGMDSQAKYAVLAAGGGDVILRLLSPSRPDYREMIWDQAAGSIVVEEAGGKVTDLDGKRLDFSKGRTLASNRGVLVTNGRLHEALLAGLKQIDA